MTGSEDELGGASTVFPVERTVRGGDVLMVREATAADAAALLVHANALAEESEFVALGPGELNLTEAEEAEFLRARHTVDNALFLVGVLDGRVVGSIDFAGGRRSRTQHTGELGMGVRKAVRRDRTGSEGPVPPRPPAGAGAGQAIRPRRALFFATILVV